MADYVNPQFESDPFTIEADTYAYVQSVFPGWDPKAAGVVRVLSEAFASAVSELIRMTTDVPPAIFRYFGGLININPQDGVPATTTVTFTAVDTAGYTIPEGTAIEIPSDAGDTEPFIIDNEVDILPGNTTVSVGFTAMNLGEQANGLTTDPFLVDILDYILVPGGVVLDTPTAGGEDAETDDEYLNRLTQRLTLLADHPVLPADFALYALSVPGVTRALAIDGYNPSTLTFNNDKMITIVAVDSAGVGVPGGVKTDIQELLEAAREVNFEVHVTDPTFTVVTVTVSVRALPNTDLTALDAAVTLAIETYLDPATWGAAGSADSTIWRLEPKVRLTNVITVIENTPGVDYIEPGTLLINGVNADLTLSGAAPMPGPTSTGNVTALAPA